MSGFEIAGIVLGSIPLVISTLEHYGDGLSTLQRWRRYQRELRCLTRNLETERVKLQNVCEKLLIGIVPPSRIEIMINNPMGNLWKEEETQRKVRVRLWKGLDAFEATIGDVERAVGEMSRRIASQHGPQASEFRRAVFTLSRSQYTDLLSTIRDGISNLENLTDRNMELEPARRLRSQGRFFMLVREMSKSIYHAIRYGLDCSCGHDVGLRLESRTADFIPTDDDEKIMSDTAFKLALSYSSSHEYPELAAWGENARIWEEIRVLRAPAPDVKVRPQDIQQAVAPRRPRGFRTKKTVAFAQLSRAHSSTTATVVQTEISAQHRSLHTSISNITMGVASIGLMSFGSTTDLCQKIQSPKDVSVQTCGLIVDHISPTPRTYAVYRAHHNTTSVHENLNIRPRSLITLKQVLEQRVHIPYRDRLQLAATISSSVLQLHGSPWLHRSISSRDIFFMKTHDYPLWNHPIVMKRHKGVEMTNERWTDSVFCNSTLFSLGILLIEIIIGKPFDSLQTPNERSSRAPEESSPQTSDKSAASILGKSSSATFLEDYITAQRLVDQHIRMASSNYGTAVTRLIDGNMQLRHFRDAAGMDSEDCCQEIYSGVVALIEKDLEYI
ncbi:hypothetical protein JDV02_003284 [Purpureocillium takamizusanense]|uniref:DUF7580 domain-containing protein n=1 Tax=Purpureocillium takamizusanense TaxID=2060973 RepID=A0A9Q8V9I2_9HYPO|nr:uncharacterized protein JDV02_003284 [Purpureocillium takamizusanense]UNI16894.1 hypothetical protein JDV02_003284 [Purpureocillium takamizusanense]